MARARAGDPPLRGEFYLILFVRDNQWGIYIIIIVLIV